MKVSTEADRRRAHALVDAVELPAEVLVSQWGDKRSDIQNRRMWAMLRDVSKQVNWHGNNLTDEEWKDVFTAALKRQRVVPGLDGGFVILGTSTRRMKVADMCELTELMFAFGAEHGVRWSDPADPINSET